MFHWRASPKDIPGRDSNRGAVRWDVLNDDCVGADQHIVANRHGSNDFGAGPDENTVPEFWKLSSFGPDRDLMLDLDVASANDAAVDDDSVRMNEYEART